MKAKLCGSNLSGELATTSRVPDLCYLAPEKVETMGFIKGFLDRVFGSTEPPRPAGPAFSSSAQSIPKPRADEFPDATINDIQRIRGEVKKRMDAERARVEAELGLDEKKKRLEKAQAYLRKADVERMFNTILRETWHWPSWLEKGELDDLPRLGIEVTEVEKTVTLENNHRRHGFTVAIGSQSYGIEILDKGRGYTPDGHGDRYGDITLTRGGDELFVCTINEVGSDYRDWKLSLYGLKVLKDVSWLPDIAGFAEIIAHRASHKQKAWNDKRVIQDAAGIIDPTAKRP